MVSLTSFPGGKVSKKDAFSVTSQMGTQRAGKVKFLCTAFKKVMLELEGIFFFNSLSQAYATVFPLTTSCKDKKNA